MIYSTIFFALLAGTTVYAYFLYFSLDLSLSVLYLAHRQGVRSSSTAMP
jgi:hypothetical protein